MLTFLGRGAGFNPKEGNTSAYFKEKDTMYLIDCGETIFAKIIELDLLKDIKTLNLFITHTHSDHSGSLGNLLLYCNFNAGVKVNFITNGTKEYIKYLSMVLTAFGIKENLYNYINTENLKSNLFKEVKYIKTTHTNTINCYSILFKTKEGIIYYSGDTNNLEQIIKICKEKIRKLYLECSYYELKDKPHLSLSDIDKIPVDKNKINIMHIDCDKLIEEAEKRGYNIVKVRE